MFKITCKGSYTIEAALIFPLILYIIIALVYLGFYLHDFGKVQAVVHESQTRGKGLVRNEVNINSGLLSYSDYLDRTIFYPIDNDFNKKESQIAEFIYKRCQDKLLISKINDIEAKVGIFDINLKIIMEVKFPFKIIEKLFNREGNIVIESKEEIHNPTTYIRGYEVSYNFVKKIDVVNKVVTGLKKLIGISK